MHQNQNLWLTVIKLNSVSQKSTHLIIEEEVDASRRLARVARPLAVASRRRVPSQVRAQRRHVLDDGARALLAARMTWSRL